MVIIIPFEYFLIILLVYGITRIIEIWIRIYCNYETLKKDSG